MRSIASFFLTPWLVLFFATSAHAEQDPPINYFDCDPPPADHPVVFAPNVVSQPGTWEEKIAFTPDGKEVFFGRHPNGGEHYFHPKIMHAEYQAGRWSSPQVAAFSESRRIGWPLLSSQGTTLFMEEYEGKIVSSQKKNGVWSELETLTPKVNAEQGFGLGQITDDDTLFFHDRYARVAYQSTKKADGHYSDPKPLSYKINPAVEFFVSAKNDYILFQPLNWQNQLHISFRNGEGEWKMPIPLGTYFDAKKWDCRGNGPSVSPDGKYLFFGKKGDIYWVKADFIEVLRKHVRE